MPRVWPFACAGGAFAFALSVLRLLSFCMQLRRDFVARVAKFGAHSDVLNTITPTVHISRPTPLASCSGSDSVHSLGSARAWSRRSDSHWPAVASGGRLGEAAKGPRKGEQRRDEPQPVDEP